MLTLLFLKVMPTVFVNLKTEANLLAKVLFQSASSIFVVLYARIRFIAINLVLILV